MEPKALPHPETHETIAECAERVARDLMADPHLKQDEVAEFIRTAIENYAAPKYRD